MVHFKRPVLEFLLLLSLLLAVKLVNAQVDPERRDQWVNYWKTKWHHPMMSNKHHHKHMTWKKHAPTYMPPPPVVVKHAYPKKHVRHPMQHHKWKVAHQSTWWAKGASKEGMSKSSKGGKGKYDSKGYWKGYKGQGHKGKGHYWKGHKGLGNKGKGHDGYWKGANHWKGKGKGKGIPQCLGCSADCIGVQEFLLIDATSNQPLMTIMPNERLDLNQLEQMYGPIEYAIECVTFGEVASTLLTDNYGTTHVDNTLPWTLSGDENGDYVATPLAQNVGPWTVTCQPFCEADATGDTSGSESIDFEVFLPQPTSPPTPSPTQSCDTCRRECIQVTGFDLVDVRVNTGAGGRTFEDSILRPINNGDVLDLSDLRQEFGNTNFTVVCRTSPLGFRPLPFAVGSTGLRDNFASNPQQGPGSNSPSDEGYYNEENNPPYTLADDDNGAYFTTDFDQLTGDWEITCQAFCDINLGWGSGVRSRGRPNPNAGDLSSDPRTVRFRVQA